MMKDDSEDTKIELKTSRVRLHSKRATPDLADDALRTLTERKVIPFPVRRRQVKALRPQSKK